MILLHDQPHPFSAHDGPATPIAFRDLLGHRQCHAGLPQRPAWSPHLLFREAAGWRPRPFGDNDFDRRIAFLLLSIVAIAGADEPIPIDREPLFRPALAGTEFHSGAHRCISLP